MTRFARAKGSKASNERVPNDATPWHVMKQNLIERDQTNTSSKQGSSEKTKSAKELLKNAEDTVSSNNVESSWAEFPNISKKINTNKVKKQKAERNEAQSNNESSAEKEFDDKLKKKRNRSEVDSCTTEVTNKKRRDKSYTKDGTNNQIDDPTNESVSTCEKLNEKKNKHKSQIKKNENNAANTNDSKNTNDTFSKRQKRNMKKRKYFNENASNTLETNNDNSQSNTYNKRSETEGENNGGRRTFKDNFANRSRSIQSYPNKFGTGKIKNEKKRKPRKIRDDKEHKRRKPDLGSEKITINGIEVEIVKFDGFPVKKEDADRLSDLKQKMIMKGIPRKDIDAAMKLERRKAEKALTRIKKCVCFHCRKAGHNLSDCPELGSEQAGTGICFKCGSTEHTHFECKVAKLSEFRYATCFICREQGHIAKQCPDNPKGIYPQGGACKVCGDVTHLKKDCPDLIKEKGESSVTVSTIANENLESLEDNEQTKEEKEDTRMKKIVKF